MSTAMTACRAAPHRVTSRRVGSSERAVRRHGLISMNSHVSMKSRIFPELVILYFYSIIKRNYKQC